ADTLSYEAPEIQEYLISPTSIPILTTLIRLIDEVSIINGDTFVTAIKNVQKETGIKGKPLWMTVRAALTGASQGPEIHQIAAIFDRETCLARLTAALNYAKSHLG
ncbi:MAG: hypothetical protein WCY30_06635, partial [Candidatus Neomarinimicrobiota bacterium]